MTHPCIAAFCFLLSDDGGGRINWIPVRSRYPSSDLAVFGIQLAHSLQGAG